MKRIATWLLMLMLCSVCLAQRGRWRQADVPTGPHDMSDRRGVPDWERDKAFPEDVFTFVRMKYDSARTDYGGFGRRWGSRWATDYPDSDLNFSFRLQQLTALRVNPDPIVLEFNDPRLFDYPFVYLIEPGSGIGINDAEVAAFRRYCENGGFVMVDDFWGEDEWNRFYADLKRVFPDREPVDVPLEHPIFHCVYDLQERPQIPSIGHAMGGLTYERWDAREVHYRALFDDHGRMMMFICHNTDLGDGWEQEGVNEFYFREFSEKKAYPLGINIVFYAMTH